MAPDGVPEQQPVHAVPEPARALEPVRARPALQPGRGLPATALVLRGPWRCLRHWRR